MRPINTSRGGDLGLTSGDYTLEEAKTSSEEKKTTTENDSNTQKNFGGFFSSKIKYPISGA